MRLIYTTTFKLKEFFGRQIPPYAILSHRWEEEEVAFQDLQDSRGPAMKGWKKIRGCCAEAAKHGFDYAWIDSCCIDKTSSTELSEAINSMFRWYTDAEVCYAFLSDVSSGLDPRELDSDFRSSKWFTRGWTLQELLAPTILVFFDLNWTEIGTKSSLVDLLTAITSVNAEHLFEIHGASVAQKMSWAARRVTTRIEDQAYCLMGLFEVNMPLLYGEGKRAFLRLQLEIVRTSDDASIFASELSSMEGFGLLAETPRAFVNSGSVVPSPLEDFRSAYSMTNRGLQIETPFLLDFDNSLSAVLYEHVSEALESIAIPLACTLDGKRLALYLSVNAGSKDQFNRQASQTPDSMVRLYRRMRNEVGRGLKTRTIFVMKPEAPHISFGPRKVFIRTQSLKDNGYDLLQIHINRGNEFTYNRLDFLDDEGDLSIMENNVIWKSSLSEISSLLLIFRKHSHRLSLQVFRSRKRVDLEIVLAEHHRDENEETIFLRHGRSWQNNGDRISKALPGRLSIHASVNVFMAEIENSYSDFPDADDGSEPALLVEAKIRGSSRGQRDVQPVVLLETRRKRSPTTAWTTIVSSRERRK